VLSHFTAAVELLMAVVLLEWEVVGLALPGSSRSRSAQPTKPARVFA
jgi:hypothetical protein